MDFQFILPVGIVKLQKTDTNDTFASLSGEKKQRTVRDNKQLAILIGSSFTGQDWGQLLTTEMCVDIARKSIL